MDDVNMPYEQVLRDPKLHFLLSNEGVVSVSSYPAATEDTKKPRVTK